MIYYKNAQEIELMRHSALLVSSCLTEVAKVLKPGITSLSVDKLIAQFIYDNGGVPSFLNFHGYPFNSCISVNDVVVHGFPNKNELKEGDIVSVDIGVILNGWHGDHAYTFAIGDPGKEVMQLIKVTKESLYKGIEKAITGNRIGDISSAVQTYVEANGFSVVRDMVGHGVGVSMHEPPEIPNFGRKGTGDKIKPGMTLAIEPMVNLGAYKTKTLSDGWTIVTADGSPSAHFEHTVLTTERGPEVLTVPRAASTPSQASA
jgi:methionyl aminopeptidase